MVKYVLKRLLISVLTIFILCAVVFFVVRIIPGSPFTNPKLSAETIERIEEYYGFTKPLPVQFVIFLKNLSHGDLGYSTFYKSQTVTGIIEASFPVSLDLGLRALAFAIVSGLTLGIVAALNRNKTWDYLSITIAIVGISVPSFVIAGLLQYGFAVKLGWFPVSRYETFASTILPAFSLGLGTLATLTRLTRTSMLEVIDSDYVKTAKSKGLSQFKIILNHQLRNALVPIVTVLGPTAAYLVTGTFVVEQIFAIPGLGRHYVLAIQNLDYSLVMGLTIFFGTILVGLNFLVDMVYGIIDPRMRV